MPIGQLTQRGVEAAMIGGEQRARLLQDEYDRRIGDVLAGCAAVDERRGRGIHRFDAPLQKAHERDGQRPGSSRLARQRFRVEMLSLRGARDRVRGW
jgi:hypothetical protein